MSETPYLSVIIAGRNDNYCGDFNSRLQIAVNWWSHLSKSYKLLTELILVNYNPLPDQASLEDLIDWPEKHNHFIIRIITVPNSIHLRFVDNNVRKTVPLFEFIAKNIGIIRANGQFILSTNADILVAEKLFQFISEKKLEPGKLYRADRLDFEPLTQPAVFRELENSIRRKVFKFYMKGGLIRIWRWPVNLEFRLKCLRIYNRIRELFYKNLALSPPFKWITFFPEMPEKHLMFFDFHCTASGDFTLMGRNDWYRLTGYLENTWTNLHVDSLLVLSAAASEMEIIELPWPIYHQMHVSREDYDGYSMKGRMGRRLEKEGNQMIETQRPTLNKDKNWGLKAVNLPEKTL